MGNEVVGYRKNASIINSYPGMHDVHVNKNVELHFMGHGQMDICGQNASDCNPVEDLGKALGYEGPFWYEWLSRISAMEGKRLPSLMHVDRRLPNVRSLK